MSEFDLPTEEDVIAKLDALMPGDQYVLTDKRHVKGQYWIYPHKHVFPDGETPFLEFTRRIRFKDEVEQINIPLTEWRDYDKLKEKTGTLITFKDSAQKPQHRALPNPLFDQAVRDLGLVVEKECMFQTRRDTDKMNGNRYLVIEGKDTSKIPPQISITSESGIVYKFYTRYAGQEYHCKRCDRTHGGVCEWKTGYKKQQTLKEQVEVDTLIVADSTMKYAEEVGLAADVHAIPGATLGDICSAIADNPTAEDKHWILMGGANDIMDSSEKTSDEQQYGFTLHKIGAKLTHLFDELRPKSVTIVEPLLQKSRLPSFEAIKRKHLMRTYLRDYTLRHGRIDYKQLLVNENIEKLQYEDGVHPSPDTTLHILKELQKEHKHPFIMNEDYAYSRIPYAGVRKLYVRGCQTCFNTERETKDILCQGCIPKAQDYNIPLKRIYDLAVQSAETEYNTPEAEREEPQKSDDVKESMENDIDMTVVKSHKKRPPENSPDSMKLLIEEKKNSKYSSKVATIGNKKLQTPKKHHDSKK